MRDLVQSIDEFITEHKDCTLEQLELEWAKVLDFYQRTSKGPAKHIVQSKVKFNIWNWSIRMFNIFRLLPGNQLTQRDEFTA